LWKLSEDSACLRARLNIHPRRAPHRPRRAFPLSRDRSRALASERRLRLESLCPGLRDGLILLPHTAAHSDSAHHLLASLQRNASREDHDAAAVGDVNAEKL